jgi:hypothetical protein
MTLGFLASFAHGAAVTGTGAAVNFNQFLSSTGSLTHAGQQFFGQPCGDFGPSIVGPCTRLDGWYEMRSAPPPPFDGNTIVTVPGTYSVLLAGVYELLPPDPFQGGPSPVGFSGSFTGSGPASMTFVWLPLFGGWTFESGVAEIHPTPEPATLPLWGTSAASLGLVRWYRRRERAHVA